MSKRVKSSMNNVCCFCGSSEDNELEFGKFYKRGDIVTHYYCLLLSSNMEQKGKDNEGILGFLIHDIQKELRRGKRLVCSYCKKGGATLGCCNVRCKQIFHYPCGLRAGTLNQFFGEFRSYCVKHRPKQKIDIEVKNEIVKTNEIVCYICYDSINSSDAINTIWAPCCKKNAWFHRKCVQQLAVSAGYFFKCPLCNDKKSFQQAMLQFGIFIPRQDASWELVPNAFQELLYRHDQCDAPICLCPKGRKYTSFNAKWELTLCRTCGSQGIHMACGKLKWANPTWECTECTSILRQTKDANSSSATTLQNDSESEGSDTDISVGKDSPISFTSIEPVLSTTPDVSAIKLRPGPRTFKLKQLRLAKEMQSLQSKSTGVLQNNLKMTTTSVLSGTEECTSNEETSAVVSNSSSVIHTVSPNCEEYTNSLPEHSKSSIASINNDVTFDEDDDVIEISNKSSTNSTLVVANANQIETNNVSQPEKIIEEKKKSSNPFIKKKLLEIDFRENVDNNSLTSNLNITETDASGELNTQDVKKSNVFEEATHNMDSDQEETDCACVDSLSKIKITNVMSLAPEEFENASSFSELQEISDTEYLTPQNNNELLSGSLISLALLTRGITSNTSLKRKFDNATLTSTPLSVNNRKKKRRNLNTHEQEQQSSFKFEDDKNTTNSIITLNNPLTLTLDENGIEVSNSNINGNNTCTDIADLRNTNQQHTEMKQDYVTNKDMLNGDTFNATHPLKGTILNNASLNSENDMSTTLLKCEQKDNNNITVTHKMNEKNKISENINREAYVRNCDGDAGTSPAIQSGNRSSADDTKESVNHSYSTSDKSDILDRRRSQNDIQTATYNVSNSVLRQKKSGTNCCNLRLISEYVRIRDLKFCISSSNNLQMILYDKFLVNINMKNAVATKKTRFDTPTRNTVQQKTFRTQNETTTNFKSEDVIHGTQAICNKDKNRYSSLVIDRDDAKENLDPVTISYKSVADNLSTNTALVVNNLTVSMNSNNQCEVGNSTQSTYNTPKAIDDNNRLDSGENVTLISTENNLSAGTVNALSCTATKSNSKHFISINPRVTNSRIEKPSIKLVRNDSFDSTKLLQRDSYFQDHTYCNTENKSTTGICCKVSIDLKKIENFIDDNPDLFSKDREKDNERNLSNRLVNSATDESKSLGNLTLSLSRDRMVGLRNYMTKNDENIKDLMAAEDLVQEMCVNNSSSHNQKYDLKRTSDRFEKQYIFNR